MQCELPILKCVRTHRAAHTVHIYMRKPTRTYASGHTDVRMHKLTHIYVMTVGNKLLIQNLNNLIHIPTE